MENDDHLPAKGRRPERIGRWLRRNAAVISALATAVGVIIGVVRP
ncbi:hypothetical protein [Kitasatospora griseola]|nr:hypothetical protein [Kitasatospora griseola]GGR00717.1 hypothetical protein GCM10010195_65650 [Kitasatospora griseola]